MNETVASAYVVENKLTIIGLHQCALGPIPFQYSMDVEGIPDGKVDFGKEDAKINEAIEKAQAPMHGLIEQQKMREGATQLVERARANDQNAIAMISAIRAAAGSGSKRARASLRLIKRYIEAHPVSEMGSDSHYSPGSTIIQSLKKKVADDAAVSAWAPGVSDSYVAAVIISRGPLLNPERVDSIGAHFGEDTPVYMLAICRPWIKCPPNANPNAFRAGSVVGLARKIQGVRDGKFPVSALSPLAGWELGE